jgi:hypothetical protein
MQNRDNHRSFTLRDGTRSMIGRRVGFWREHGIHDTGIVNAAWSETLDEGRGARSIWLHVHADDGVAFERSAKECWATT